MLLGVSQSLQQYLLTAIPDSRADWVKIEAFQQDEAVSANNLIVFLYAAEENPHLRNQPLQPTEAGYVRHPLALTLHYLVAYSSKDSDEVQRRLSSVLQAFHSRPRLGPADLHSSLLGRVESLSVRLRDMTPDELNKLWTALNVGMRLALYYEVDAALIAPVEPDVTGPVDRRELRYERVRT